jgi:hypothetical protein
MKSMEIIVIFPQIFFELILHWHLTISPTC